MSEDQAAVQKVIEKQFKCQLNPHTLFGFNGGEGSAASRACLADFTLLSNILLRIDI